MTTDPRTTTRPRFWLRPSAAQVRLGLRVTVAAVVTFVLAQLLNAPLAGLWAVLTAVVVTQTSVGGSLKVTIEYLVGTLSGAIYAGAIAAFVPHHNELTLLLVMALAIGPLALLAAMSPHFRIGPFTAAIVVVGTSATQAGPIDSAIFRVLEVALGAATGLTVSLLVLPARAQALVTDAAVRMLDLLAQAIPDLFAGLTRPLEVAELRRIQDGIGAALARIDAIAVEARRERLSYLASEPDCGPLLRTLLRLRHDLIIVGRAAAAPLPERFAVRLGPPLTSFARAAADYLRASSAALKARREPPSLAAVEEALAAHAAAIEAARRERLSQDLPAEVVERIFALAFALDQMHRNFGDLARCLNEFAQPAESPLMKVGASPDQSS